VAVVLEEIIDKYCVKMLSLCQYLKDSQPVF
jgi:hypothetical protein